MLVGKFDESGKPHLRGIIVLPRLSKSIYINFLVDTGADITLLTPSDGIRTGLTTSLVSGTDELFQGCPSQNHPLGGGGLLLGQKCSVVETERPPLGMGATPKEMWRS